jgi:hypothetical protein
MKRQTHWAAWAWAVIMSVGLFGWAGWIPQVNAEVPSATTWRLLNSLKVHTLTVDTKLVTTDGHVYLRVLLTEEVKSQLTNVYTGMIQVVVHGKVHGVGALFSGTEALLLRLVTADVPADGLEVTLLSTDQETYLTRSEGSVTRLVINGAKAAPTNADMERAFWKAMEYALDQYSSPISARSSPFFAFIQARMKQLAAGELAAIRAVGPRRANRDQMMSLLTGVASIDETLQIDRALRVRGQATSAQTVALADVKPLPLPAHPWEKMTKDIPGEPVVEPLAAAVPETMMYAHFHDLRSLLKVGGDVERRGPLLGLTIGEASADSHVIKRYEAQLVLERMGLAEKVGHLATSGVAIAIGDPFVRDGSDVSLLFKVTNRAMLLSAFELYEANARAKRPDLTVSTYTIEGFEVRRLSTPDRVHDQHRVELGDLLIISNSPAALTQLIAVHQGKAKALSQAGDFLYMRNLYPFDTKAEDGFVFISDAAVMHATSPRTRILQARRMEAKADMQAIAFSALMYGWLEGKPVERADALVTNKVLLADELQHADGTAITFDRTKGPSSEIWGRPAALTPLSDLTLTHVSPDERDAYDQFRDEYQQYWRKFVDPIAIRIRRLDDGKTLDLDVRILPLIDQSEYQELADVVGDTFFTLSPPSAAGAIEFIIAIDKDMKWRAVLDSEAKFLSISVVPSAFVGEWFVMGGAEQADMWKAVRALREFPLTGPRETVSGEKEMIGKLRKTSLFFGLHLTDPAACTQFLWELDKLSSAMNITGKITLTKYKDVEIAHVPLDARGMGSDLGYSLGYFVVVKDVLLYAFNEETIQKQIDRVLDDGFPKVSPKPTAPYEPKPPYAATKPAQSALRLGWPSADGDLPKLALDFLEYQALTGCISASMSFEVLARGLTFLPTDPELLQQLTLAYLGAQPVCAHGGTFSIDPYGVVQHSLYGSAFAPTPYSVPLKGSPITDAIGSLRDLTTQISFEGEGDHRGLHVQLQWQNR